MKIKDYIYKTPEMTEEKLLELIKEYKSFVRKHTLTRLNEIHNHPESIEKAILKEWDVINDKKSYLSKSERDEICGLVSSCLIMMTKDDGREQSNND